MHLQQQGELQHTNQPLDLAFDEDGFLLVKDKSGTPGGARTGAVSPYQRRKEADGVYSFHGSASYLDGSHDAFLSTTLF
jgi:flagellar basal body rod protein FlgF